MTDQANYSLTIRDERDTARIIRVIRAEWPELDYLRCTDNRLAEEGVARFRGQTKMGGDRYFLANTLTGSIIHHTEDGVVKARVEF